MTHSSPVILFGALRSGTTVLRQMLDGHPTLHNPGEADYLFDYIHRTDGGWRYDLDGLGVNRIFVDSGVRLPEGAAALPGEDLLSQFLDQLGAMGQGRLVLAIHRHVDKVVALLPEARILHLVRDPRDVARSAIGLGWAGSPYFGVDGWIETEKTWDRAAYAIGQDMALSLKYEDLIAEPEAQLTAACRFLDLPFDPGLLSYHERSTYGPPDPSLIEQWRRKMPVRDLALVEGKLGPMLTGRGYEPSGTAPHTPGLLEHVMLAAVNKTATWRFAMNRYGAGTVLLEKLSRRLGLKALHRRMMVRINHRARAFLK